MIVCTSCCRENAETDAPLDALTCGACGAGPMIRVRQASSEWEGAVARTVASGIGGAVLGAALMGGLGALVLGVVGAIAGSAVRDA